MRSKTWSRRLWKSPPLLLFFLIGAVILWNNVEFVGAESTVDANPDGIADAAAEDDGNPADTTLPDATTGDASSVDLSLSSTGNCSEEIKNFCDLKSETALECISKKLKSENAKDVSEGCKQEWRDAKLTFYILSGDKKLEDACKNDIDAKCREQPGGVLACLRTAKEGLSQACQDQILAAEQDAVDDYRMDPSLRRECSGDAATYCKGVENGEGRVQACLRDHSQKISYNCRAQLFRQERENADDLRLNPELFEACLPAQRKFCPDVLFGKARVKDCLESHRLDPEFPAACKIEFDKMLARRSADFRLNPTLVEKCAKDINMICDAHLQDSSPVQNEEPKIIHCLQDFRDDLHNECKVEVHKLLALAAEDYRFDKEFSDSCEASKQKLCKDIENDKVLSCLQSKREQLDTKCRAAVFSMEWRLSGDIDYKFAMKQACVVETGKFCHDRRHDRGAIIDCLQERVDDSEMGADCKKEIVADEVESAQDFRLNYRIYKDCQDDVKSLCPVWEKCKGPEPCGGVVLQCLQEKVDQLSSEECKKDVVSFEIKESKNEELNIPLQKACQDDLVKQCPRVKSNDHSRSLACLRRHRNELKKECKEEELRFSMMEASDIRLTPSLMNACGAEINHFCPKVSPTNGETFKCLQLNLESINMGVPCKVEVDLQGARQAEDYRLDVRVRTECKEDVNKFCSGVSKDEDGHAQVLKCFVNQYKNLTGGCQSEVEYAVRMALFQYKFDSNLTFPCDEVVKKSCDPNEAKPIEGVVIGTYGQCLITQGRRTLNPDCRLLVRVATKNGAFAFLNGNTTNAELAAALLKYKELIGGDDLSHSGIGFFWVTTVVAFVALLAVALFRRYSGPPKTYTLVVKQGDV
ncbi:unnamed protein product [Calypogeia fissa]